MCLFITSDISHLAYRQWKEAAERPFCSLLHFKTQEQYHLQAPHPSMHACMLKKKKKKIDSDPGFIYQNSICGLEWTISGQVQNVQRKKD